MLESLLPQLGLLVFLVVLNAVFAGSEIALISLREGQLQRLERRSRTGRVLARLARDPNRFLATIQIGITLAGFLASAFAAVTLAEPLVPTLEFLGRAAELVAIVGVTAILTFVTLVIGELAPKRIAMQRAESWGLLVAGHVVELRENSSSGTIREVAERLNTSMLVIGSHGRSGVKRLVLGSTADALTRGGHIPVLVVRPTSAEAYAEL